MNREAFLHGVVDELGKCASVDTVSDLFAFLRREGHRVSTSPLDKQMKARFGPKGMGKKANGDEEEENKGPAPSEEDVIKFLKKHPSPRDEVFHEWAEENGFNVHKAEAVAYKIISDLVTKGRSKGKTPSNVDKVDQARGVDIEKEHTPNMLIRQKIRNDHNEEFKQYYDKRRGLPALEDSLKKGASARKTLKTVGHLGAAFGAGAGTLHAIQALRHKKKKMEKKAAFLNAFLEGLQKFGFNGGVGTATVRPGTAESRSLREALKAKGVWEGKSPSIISRLFRSRPSTSHLKVTQARKPASDKERAQSISRALGGSLSDIPSISKAAALAGPPTLAKLRRAYPKGRPNVVTSRVADPQAAAKKMPEFPKAATLAGRATYLLKRLAGPVRREIAGGRGQEALDKGKLRKAMRYGGVKAGLGPSFGREPKKAKRLIESLRPAKV